MLKMMEDSNINNNVPAMTTGGTPCVNNRLATLTTAEPMMMLARIQTKAF
jgi:hypothetical protein